MADNYPVPVDWKVRPNTMGSIGKNGNLQLGFLRSTTCDSPSIRPAPGDTRLNSGRTFLESPLSTLTHKFYRPTFVLWTRTQKPSSKPWTCHGSVRTMRLLRIN